MTDAHPRSSAPLLSKGASLVTMDAELGDMVCADILIRGERIVDIGHLADITDAEVIDARGMIAIPGFVETHRHLWEALLRNGFPNATLKEYFDIVNERFGPAHEAEDFTSPPW